MADLSIPLPLTLVITMSEGGLYNINGPINVKFICDGLIEGAKRRIELFADHFSIEEQDTIEITYPLVMSITFTKKQTFEISWPHASRFVCDAMLEGARDSIVEYLQRKKDLQKSIVGAGANINAELSKLVNIAKQQPILFGRK